MAGTICGLCAQAVEPDSYYRQLDCSRNCEDNVFHEPCIERYLRKHGRGAEQKTGFACPATLPNGKPCLGTIKKTHMRLPANAKKKEQNKQAAIAVNVMVNTARAVAPAASASTSKANPAVGQYTKAAGKIAKIATGQRPPTVVRSGRTSVTAAAANSPESSEQAEDDFSNYRPIGKRSSKRDDDECDTDGESELPRLQKRQSEIAFQGQVPRPFKPPVNKIAASRPLSKSATAVSAISKNSAMAPEPVVRQPITIPGWTDSAKVPASVSNLAEQRALVAALRAQGNASSANRASNAAVTAITAAGASKNVTGTGCMDKAEAQEINLEPSARQPSMGSDTAAVAMTTPATPGAMAAATEQQLHHISKYGDDATSPPESLTASLDTPGDASPASFEQTAQNDADPDPVIDYDLILSAEDNTPIVQDKRTGMFMRMEDVYGPEPERVGFLDEASGQIYYYVVVRASFAAAQLAAQQLEYTVAADGDEAWEARGSGGGRGNATLVEPWLHSAASVRPEEYQLGPMLSAGMPKEAAGFGVGASLSSPSPVAVGEGEGEEGEDLEELMALCLG